MALGSPVRMMYILSPAFLSGFLSSLWPTFSYMRCIRPYTVLDRASESLKMFPRESDVSDPKAHMSDLTPNSSFLAVFPLGQPMRNIPCCLMHQRASRPRGKTCPQIVSH